MVLVERSLFKTVLNFVTDHLSSVESLLNIPEVVGEEIFKSAVQKDVFRDYQQADKCLQLFVSAYEAVVLSSLCLRGSLLLINEYTDPLISLSKYVEHLDLTGCHLGDTHEVIAAISQFASLKTLHLRENELSGDGLRKITLPCRMFDRGPLLLNELDLSDNPAINDKAVVSLCCFTKLSLINLSNTKVTVKGALKLCSQLGLSLCSQEQWQPHLVATIGWAAPLINQWHDQMECATSQRKRMRLLLSPTKTGFFSYKKVVKLGSPSASPTKCTSTLVLRRLPQQPLHQQHQATSTSAQRKLF